MINQSSAGESQAPRDDSVQIEDVSAAPNTDGLEETEPIEVIEPSNDSQNTQQVIVNNRVHIDLM